MKSPENPRMMLQLMEDLKKCGFKPAFTFDDGMLELVIKRNRITNFY